MVKRKSVNFLPGVFQTQTNRRFLNATMDQLIQEPALQQIYGYLGQQDLSPNYKTGDFYVNEIDQYSQFYQLEPGLVVRRKQNNSNNYVNQNVYNYVDILNQISSDGGLNRDHSRLFTQEFYSYNAFCDLDKLVNYTQYYWAPSGPVAVNVNGSTNHLPIADSDLYIHRNQISPNSNLPNIDIAKPGYTIDSIAAHVNPDLYLVRGCTYNFHINQTGNKLWIQSEPGLTGQAVIQKNINTRDIFGVYNNGADTGTVRFTVPLRTAQDNLINLPEFTLGVDVVLDVPFNSLQAADYDTVIKSTGLDGIKSFRNKTVIFTSTTGWPANVPGNYRQGVWNLNVDANNQIQLTYNQDFPRGHKLFVREGATYGHLWVYRDALGRVSKFPNLTASVDTLYYQDSNNVNYYGVIHIIDPDPISVLDVSHILGSKQYTSPNGVRFTSGLKVRFTGSVNPTSYLSDEWVVEGVGKSINLIPWSKLVTPEKYNNVLGSQFDDVYTPFDISPYDTNRNNPQTKDYMVVSRNSPDLNAWSRNNRWVHKDVLQYAADTAGVTLTLDNSFQAKRPIIEMHPGLQMFNNGKNFLDVITVFDTTTTDAFTTIEGQNNFALKSEFTNKATSAISAVGTTELYFTDLNNIKVGNIVTGIGISIKTAVTKLNKLTNSITISNAVLNDVEVNTEIFFGTYNSDGIQLANGTKIVFAADSRAVVRNTIFEVQNILAHSPSVITLATVKYSEKFTTTLYLNSLQGITIGTRVDSIVNANGYVIPQKSGNTVTSIDFNTGSVTISQYLSTAVSIGSTVTLINDTDQIHLVPVATATEGDCIVVNSGIQNQGNSYFLKNGYWVYCQQKVSRNQAPLYDIFDASGYSLSNTTQYPSSNFRGTRLFGYADATGNADTELGKPIKYQTIGNLGDIVFANYYQTDTFVYNLNFVDQTGYVNSGFAVLNTSDGRRLQQNGWSTVPDKSKQQHVIKKIVTTAQFNNFRFPVTYTASSFTQNIQVRVNHILLNTTEYKLQAGPDYFILNLNNDLADGDQLVITLAGNNKNYINVYTVPVNLSDNSANDTFDSITLGQMRNHVIELSTNLIEFTGAGAGDNNLRDIDYSLSHGKLLQHSAGVHVHAIQSVNSLTNLITGIKFNMNAYSQFKALLIDRINNTEFTNPTDQRTNLDIILSDLKANISSTDAFFCTDMIASGPNYVTNSYTIQNLGYRTFNLINDYSAKPYGYQAVMVYLNNILLLKDHDYTISGYVVTLNAKLPMSRLDTVTINEYPSTLGCNVPATPTKLGLYPAYIPVKYTDNTYTKPQNMIVGHDGSRTMGWGDYRDDILIEYERRVFNNLSVYYQNDLKHDLLSIVPGAFRKTDYTIEEWTQLLSGSFLEWSGKYNVDIFTNNTVNNSLFSFNYANGVDRLFNDTVPGFWRGMYKYFFDTDRPHTSPWEMLGFSIKPVWWTSYYGPAPYTSENTTMWADLEAGFVFNGSTTRSYVSNRYARPGLSKIIPVDRHGNLLDPQRFLLTSWNTNTASNNWRIGDQSPQESSWRNSSYYPFAVQIAWALARPAEYASLKFNTRDYYKNSQLQQIINARYNNRKWDSTLTSVTEYRPGTNVWIRDYLANRNLDLISNWDNYVANTKLNLTYKITGYTDKKHIQLVADQISPQTTNKSILIPAENYDIIFSKSAVVGRAIYSAVAISKTPAGYQIYGFDLNRPYFLVIPSVVNSNSYTIKVGTESAIVYRDAANNVQTYPYGTVFVNRQQVCDFLISYGRYLTSQGFIFDDVLADQQTVQDWQLAIREFLFFTSQNWGPEVVISLTPAGTTIKFQSAIGTVEQLSNRGDYTRVIDSDGKTLTGTDYRVYRESTRFEIGLKNLQKGIHLLDMAIVQYQHSLVLDNQTIFNDTIYDPAIGNRQYRIKIQGYKTQQWDGSLYAPGFLVNSQAIEPWQSYTDYYKGDIVVFKNKYYTAQKFISGNTTFEQSSWYEISDTLLNQKLIPTPAFNASQFGSFYDVDKQDVNTDADMLARHSTGFSERTYFADLGLDIISQHKFYLGMIKQKGSQAVVNAFSRGRGAYQDTDISLNEQYTIRLDRFGNTQQQSLYEVSLKGAVSINNQYPIVFLNNNDLYQDKVNSYRPADFLQRPVSYTKDAFADNRDSKIVIPTAGPVKLTDVSATVFSIQKIYSIDGLAQTLGEGNLIWVASDSANQWAVYRVSTTDRLYATQVAQTGPEELTFTTNLAHGYQILDTLMLRSTKIKSDSMVNGVDLAGFYKISAVTNNTFSVKIRNTNQIINGSIATIIYKLINVRFNSKADFITYTPARGWQIGDIAYIDNTPTGYQVLQNKRAWTLNDTRHPVYIKPTDKFGSGIVINSRQNFAVVSAPYKGTTGMAFVYALTPENNWQETTSLYPDASCGGFGTSVDINDLNLVALGSPDSDDRGTVYIAAISNTEVKLVQALHYDLDSGSKFGSAVAMSQDGNWLYVSDPVNSQVYVYKYHTVDYDYARHTGNGADYIFDFPNQASGQDYDINDISVYNNNRLLVPNIDYTKVAGPGPDAITMTSVPDSGNVIELFYRNYYKLQNIITSDNPGSVNFGHALATDATGRMLVISDNKAPGSLGTQSYENNGDVTILQRVIEKFTATAGQTVFTTVLDFSILQNTAATGNYKIDPVIYIDQRLAVEYTDFTISSNTITFYKGLTAGTTVVIETQMYAVIDTLDNSIMPQIGMNYGDSVKITADGNTLFVGAPGYRYVNNQNGVVYRYVNKSRRYNAAVGTIANPTLTPNSTFYINDYQVQFTTGRTQNIIDSINKAGIPGITASLTNGYVIIAADPTVTDQGVSLTEFNIMGTGEFLYTNNGVMTALGMNQYTQLQKIFSPLLQDTERFGERLSISPDNLKLVVGATVSNNQLITTFDNSFTTWDNGTTSQFIDKIYRSGNAHVYEYQESSTETINDPGGFSHANNLTTNNISSNSLFSTAVAISDNWILISAPNGKVNSVDAGVLYTFNNPDSGSIWQVIREQGAKFNSNLISHAYLYDNKTRTKIADLTVLDPVHGKNLPAVVKNIDYIVNYDPAVYTNSPTSVGFNTNIRNAWHKNKVGTVWWDINSIKYYDFEQGDVQYRMNNWGLGFPQSSIAIYQWIESDMMPSIWARNYPNQLPLYIKNDVYTTKTVIDPTTLQAVTRYYFWIRNGTEKNISTRELQARLANTRITTDPFIAVLDTNALALYNCEGIIGDSTSLVIKTDQGSESIVHSEWGMFDDGSDLGSAPEFYNKVRDSLTVQDQNGRSVPDLSLPVKQQYGTSIRPRQTVFTDPYAARKLFITEVNLICATQPMRLLREKAISKLMASDPVPDVTQYTVSVNNITELTYLDKNRFKTGDVALVLSDGYAQDRWTLRTLSGVYGNNWWQITKVQIWNISNYWNYTDWYSPGFNASVTPTHIVDTEADISTLTLYVGDIVYVKNSKEGGWKYIQAETNSLTLMAQQNATIGFYSNLYDNPVAGFGLDTTSFETTAYSQDANIEFGKIFDIVQDELLTAEFRGNYKAVMKLMINTILTQLDDPDWIQKSSLVDIYHRVRGLTQIPIYVPQPETIVTDFFNEVKPFHTKVKQYVAKYDNIDAPDLATFDLTDFDLEPYYNTIVNRYRSPQLGNSLDTTALTQNVYSYWLNNHGYSISQITVSDAGAGYTPNNVSVQIIGDGTGAQATAYVVNGVISKILVDNPGIGYTRATIKIYGLGTGATAFAQMGTNLARTFQTLITYDRYRYTNSIQDWAAGTAYAIDDVVVYNHQPYRCVQAHTSSAKFVYLNFALLVVKIWYRNTEYNIADVVVYNRVAYVATATFASGEFFDTTYLTTYTGKTLDNAADRIWAYYAPNTGMAGRDLSQLMTGIAYPGVQVLGPDFNQTGGYGVVDFDTISYDLQETDAEGLPIIHGRQAIDSIYYSLFTDQNLGLRPEDMLTDGGKFLDTYSSHAPEELVPGQIFDTLDIRVKTLAGIPGITVLNPEIITLSYLTDGKSTEYSFDPLVTGTSWPANGVEHVLVVIAESGTQILDTDYTVDFENKLIKFTYTINKNYNIYITLLGATGFNEVTGQNYVADGITTDYLINDISITSAKQCYIKINGVQVSNYSLHEKADHTGVLARITPPPAAGSIIDIRVYDFPAASQAFARIAEQTFTAAGNAYPSQHTFTLTNPVLYSEPASSYAIVQINRRHLIPSQQIYYTANGIDTIYDLNHHRAEVKTNIADGEITVVMNQTTLSKNTDYQILRPASDWPQIKFFVTPVAGSKIIISDTSNADYRIINQNQLIIRETLVLQAGDKINVMTFGNHDMIDLRTYVYSGDPDAQELIDLGFDPASIGMDNVGFDNELVNVKNGRALDLSIAVSNLSDLYITVNSKQIFPYLDYLLTSPTSLLFSTPISNTDLITLRIFAGTTNTSGSEFRIFKDLHDQNTYLRITDTATAYLTQDVYITDRWIYVDNINALSDPDPSSNHPGVFIVNGERILYGAKDVINKRLGNLRRSTAGTGGAHVHLTGSRVIDSGIHQQIPGSDDVLVTLPTNTGLLNIKTGMKVGLVKGTQVKQSQLWQLSGETLAQSQTVQAKFIRSH